MLELGLAAPPGAGEHVLGVWRPLDRRADEISFSHSQPPLQVWRANLPRDLHQAAAIQQQARWRLERAEKTLRLMARPLTGPAEAAALEVSEPPRTSLLEACRRAAIRRASVETVLGGRLVGWSMLDWSGRIDTVWPTPLPPDAAARHMAALELTMLTRAALLHVLAIAAQGATALAAAASPLGPLAAAPAAWTFIARVLEEGQWIRTQRQALRAAPSF